MIIKIPRKIFQNLLSCFTVLFCHFFAIVHRYLNKKNLLSKIFQNILTNIFRELMTIHNQMKLGKDPHREDSLRSAIAGKRRGIPTETQKAPTPNTAGVRFRGGSDEED